MTVLERQILSTMVMEKNVRPHAYVIDQEDFTDIKAREILQYIKDNINEDPITMFQAIHRHYNVPPEFVDDAATEHGFKLLVDEFSTEASRRILLKRLGHLLNDAKGGHYQPEHAAEELAAMLNIVEHSTEGKYKSTVEAGQELVENLEMIWSNRKNTIKLPYLDELTTDLFGGEFITIAGRPGMGKTAVMLNMARKLAANGTPVGFVSLEMKSDALMLRLIQKNWDKSLKYNLKHLNGEERKQIHSDIKEASELPIYFNDEVDSKLGGLMASINMMAQGEGCRVIFIDYLQLMPTNKHDSRNNEVAEISRRLKLLAQDLGIVIVAGSQLSRGVEQRNDKTPKLADLRDSGAIEQDCDMVIFCYRPVYYYHKEDEQWLDLIVAKQRDGITGTQQVRFMLERQLIIEGANYKEG